MKGRTALAVGDSQPESATRATILPLLWLALALCCGGAKDRPNVLLVTLDTTRPDHLSTYGYERETSPHLDLLAREAIVFENAYSTSSWTLPAHASLFTARYPTGHGVRHDPEGDLVLADEVEAPEAIRANSLSPHEATLASLLREEGYATGAVVSGPWLMRTFGLSRGFDHYDDQGIADLAGRRAEQVTTAALGWLDQIRDQPFLLFVNYFDPHWPYDPPRQYLRRFLDGRPIAKDVASLIAAYDAEIAYMDAELGRLLDSLRERGLYQNTLIVVTGDHGEAFGEHGYWLHERFLWEELVRIPLVVKPPGPGSEARRESERISLVGILPLILESLGLPALEHGPSRTPGSPAPPIFAEVSPSTPTEATGDWRAIWQGRHKLMWSRDGRALLFDLALDPGEARNRFAEDGELARKLQKTATVEFGRMDRASLPRRPSKSVSDETREALRRLGYLE